IVRALWQNILGHKIRQGGSTITQQLARNVYLTQRKTVERKAQEAVLAILLERNFTKDKILELYLNRVYYGSGAFGVQAASKVYFGKDVNQLDLSECALLAGLPQRPSVYSPHEDLQAALNRRNLVLKRMEDLGFITHDQRIAAKNEKITIVPRARGRSTYKAPHFVDYVTGELRKRYPDDVIFSGGLRVYTTLNYEMQKIAERALRNTIKAQRKARRVSEGCFVAIEPATGYIRAMVGSVDPSSHYNRCTQGYGRQPGSAFKAFVYTAAFEEGGMRPSTHVPGGRRRYRGANGRVWSPRNYDGWYPASISIKVAIAKSVNTAAVYTADKVGIEKVIKYARLMGIHSELQPYLSTAIGGVKGVHPLEMASAYGTFANGGVHVEPCCVVRITNSRGDVLEDYSPEGKQVISKRTCEMMDECLRAVVTSGTGIRARDVPQARGKTGTTNDDRDAWFIGYVPGKLVAACWAGNDDYSPMRRAYGGVVCLPVWREFMLRAIPIYDRIHREEENRNSNKPARKHTDAVDGGEQQGPAGGEPNAGPTPDVTMTEGTRAYRICDESQLLATPSCPSTHIETFAANEAPTSYCTIHRRPEGEPAGEAVRRPAKTPSAAAHTETASPERQLTTVFVCGESGMLAGPYCPVVKKHMAVEDVPTQVCNVHRRPAGR
ncbi:MAG: transglycosylase domain-containing protein, partial [Armatimonadota bacterium]